jgi:hypothetical protein
MFKRATDSGRRRRGDSLSDLHDVRRGDESLSQGCILQVRGKALHDAYRLMVRAERGHRGSAC